MTKDPYLFISIDDEGKAHPVSCPDVATLTTAVRESMFMPGDIEPDEQEQIDATVGKLLESGVVHFEGDPPLFLFHVAQEGA